MSAGRSTADDLADPLLGPWLKGFPGAAEPVRLSDVGARRWNVLAGDLGFPLAVLDRRALVHNIAWMARFVRERGVGIAPHGKTTMSPQLFTRQLAAGAWGITFANAFQLRLGVLAGVRRALIANQVVSAPELAALAALQAQHADLRFAFLVDSAAQLAAIEAWRRAQPRPPVFDVLLEIGVPGGRTGVRGHGDAVALARALRASAAVRLVGIEAYEGLAVSGDSGRDEAAVDALMQRLAALAREIEPLFEADEVIVSVGGSAVFDLVAARLALPLARPVRALLRSGCYVTHDHGNYQRLLQPLLQRCGCDAGLEAALTVWAVVQSTPEPGLALLGAGRRDLSFDIDLPRPVAVARAGSRAALAPPPGWQVDRLNDQHAYLRTAPGDEPQVGDLVALGISHPCTTFDKWHWMPIVDDDLNVVDAVTIHF